MGGYLFTGSGWLEMIDRLKIIGGNPIHPWLELISPRVVMWTLHHGNAMHTLDIGLLIIY